MHLILIIIIFLLTPSLIIGALVFLQEKNKKQIERSVQKLFDHVVLSQKLLMADMEFFGKRAIGVDISNKKVAFVEYRKKKPIQLCIDLQNVPFCGIEEIRDQHSQSTNQVFI